MLIDPEDKETFRQSQIDQFLTHCRTVYEAMTGQPFGRRAQHGMAVFATILSATGQGTLANEGPNGAARAMIGACEIVSAAYLIEPASDPAP